MRTPCAVRLLRAALPLVLLASIPGGVASGADRDTPAPDLTAVRARVEAAVRSRDSRALRSAVGVWHAGSGAAVLELRAARPQRPASVQKLVTTGAALLRLGTDHELATEVRGAGTVAGGVLRGDLWVVGGGDPGLCGRFADGDPEAALRALAAAVRRRGVERVTGDLVLDDREFSDRGRDPAWNWKDGEWDWWSAPVSALTINDNCVDVTVLPGAGAGDPARIALAPATGAVVLDNRLVTTAVRKEHRIVFGPRDPAGRVPVRGKVWKGSTGYTVSLALVDPLPFFGDVFLRLLREEGVAVAGGVVDARTLDPAGPRAAAGSGAPLLARHATTVGATVEVTNTRSQNLYAELLLRALGRQEGGTGTAAEGARIARQTLGFDDTDDALVQVDGCGLARTNQVTAGAVGRVLLRLYASDARIPFMNSLALGGDSDGTLRRRFRAERFENRVLAKTGTLSDTTCLAGYVLAHSGEVYAFAVLCEGGRETGRALQDAVVDALVGTPSSRREDGRGDGREDGRDDGREEDR